jgi:hypothetical protein
MRHFGGRRTAFAASNSQFRNFSHGKTLKNNGMIDSILYIVYFFGDSRKEG